MTLRFSARFSWTQTRSNYLSHNLGIMRASLFKPFNKVVKYP